MPKLPLALEIMSPLASVIGAFGNQGNDSKSADPTGQAAKPAGFKHGGTVQKTGMALVHKGETVIPNDNDEDDGSNEPNHSVSLYRAMHHLKKGGLHRALGVPIGEKIPADKLASARKSKNEHVKHMANFAHTMGTFSK